MRHPFQFITRTLILLLCTSAPALANTEATLMKFIRCAEVTCHTSAYDQPYALFPIQPPKPLTSMTIAEVLAFQKSAKKTKSTAMGAYQIIHETLDTLVREHTINKASKFDRPMQDHMARLLMAECQPLQTNKIKYGNCLARIWAALPVLSGPKKGKSHYEGIADNEARATVGEFQQALNGIAVASLQKNNDPLSKRQTATRNRSTFSSAQDRMNAFRKLREEANKSGNLPRSVRTLTFDPYALE